MKKIIINHGFEDQFPFHIIKGTGHHIFSFPDRSSKFEIKTYTNKHPYLFINNKPVVKNDAPAVPPLARTKDENDQIQLVCLISPDKTWGINDIDLYIPCLDARTIDKEIRLLEFFHFYDVPTVETATAVKTTLHKIDIYKKLSSIDLPIPPSEVLYKKDTETATKQAMEFFIKHSGKVVLKGNTLIKEQNIYVPQSPVDLVDSINALFDCGTDILIQKYIKTGKSVHHMRIAMCFGEIVCTQKLTTQEGLKTSHSHTAQTTADVILTREIEETCKTIAKTIGCNIANINGLISEAGEFYVLDIDIMPNVINHFPDHAEYITKQIIKNCL